MRKIIGGAVLAVILAAVFVAALWHYMNNSAGRGVDTDIEAEQGKGAVPGDSLRVKGARKTPKVSKTQDEVLAYRLRSREKTKQIQLALKKAGFYKGDIDGKMGSQTRAAVRGFQESRGLVADGIVGPKTWDELSEYMQNKKDER